MTKELKFIKMSNAGKIEITLRIIGKYLFFKYNDTAYSRQAVEHFKKSGLNIVEKGGWLKVDIFGDNTLVQLGTIEINLETEIDTEIEQKLADFYTAQYKLNGFVQI